MRSTHSMWQRTFAVAGLAAAAACSLTAVAEAIDGGLHGGYARLLAGDSATQSVVLVDVGAGPAPAGLVAALAGDGPRLVLDAEGWTGCRLRGTASDCLLGPAPGDRVEGTGLWIHPDAPVFAALAAVGAGREGPLSVRYVRRLPTVPAARVAELPAGTLTGRVVVVGRADAAAATVGTPMGMMSPAQVEAQALLGVFDGAARAHVPGWLRALGLVVWAVMTAALLQRRGPWLVARTAAAAAMLALVLDAGLYVGGVAAVGAGAAVVAAIVAATLQVGLVWVAARTGARHGVPAGASGLHKVSG